MSATESSDVENKREKIGPIWTDRRTDQKSLQGDRMRMVTRNWI